MKITNVRFDTDLTTFAPVVKFDCEMSVETAKETENTDTNFQAVAMNIGVEVINAVKDGLKVRPGTP